MKKQDQERLDKLILQICQGRITTEWKHLNYMLIPVSVIAAKEGNETAFNEIYKLLYDNNVSKIKRTASGGISINLTERFNFDKYDVRQLNGCIELTICTLEKSCRIQFRLPNYKEEETEEEKLISAGSYLKKWWLPTCKKHGINMNDYCCSKEEGLEYKKQIHEPDIKIYDPAASFNVPYKKANHLDFHKFYISGLAESHPEFKPVIEELTELAKTDKMHKTGLASMIGYFQSKYCQYRYAKLSKDAINNAYARFDKIKEELKKSGRRILATNTDGIWYVGEEFHGIYEGPGLTEWNNDHVNCYIRFKSAGAYEFIENEKYFPVIRGRTRLDKLKPRSQWVWGDIFNRNATVIKWHFIEGQGISWEGAK